MLEGWNEQFAEARHPNNRSRLGERGLARFEVLGRDADRDLIRSLARRLAEDTPEVSALRIALSESVAADPPKSGGVLAALRRSPMVGVDLDLAGTREEGRHAPRKRIDAILLRALTATMRPQAESTADLVRSMRDGDRT